MVSFQTKFSVNPATNLRVYASQIGISTFGFTWTMGGHVMVSHSGSGNPRRGTLNHTRAHVGSCRRTNTASQASQIQVAGGQIRGQVTATVVGGVEESETEMVGSKLKGGKLVSFYKLHKTIAKSPPRS